LAAALDITYAEARKAVARLRLSGEFPVLLESECSACGHVRVTVRATTRDVAAN
jgi:hypothetical protein